VADTLDQVLSDRPAGSVRIYFRADDIAVPSQGLKRLLTLFQTYNTPLALAVVPAWLTPTRWKTLFRWGNRTPELWCWHQHGWRHVNHAIPGNSAQKFKKAEFGDHRSQTALALDMQKGFDRLANLMGRQFVPLFTPPWNRVGSRALAALNSIGYDAISRDAAQSRHLPAPLPELPVHVDLHTHKAPGPAQARQYLLDCLAASLTRNTCGFMIHHQCMNDRAFAFLEFLIDTLNRHNATQAVSIMDTMS
jgi:hypothetical protein